MKQDRYLVVNCFQNTNFSEDSQAKLIKQTVGFCCELLSEY